MLPGYTNLEASSDGILLFRRHTLTINSWMMAFCEAPTTTPEIGISVYKLPETRALTLVTESVLCVCACVCFFWQGYWWNYFLNYFFKKSLCLIVWYWQNFHLKNCFCNLFTSSSPSSS
jgi:hypothetical protein